jgi:hypothetical protein
MIRWLNAYGVAPVVGLFMVLVVLDVAIGWFERGAVLAEDA